MHSFSRFFLIVNKNFIFSLFFYIEPAKILGKLENVTVNEGQNASFNIKYSGKPKPTIKWFKEEEEIDTSLIELYEIVEVDDTINLIIKAANIQSEGSYFSKIINEISSVNSNKAQLLLNSTFFVKKTFNSLFIFKNFSEKPKFIKVPKNPGSLNKDESLNLEYSVDGNPKPNIQWYFIFII